MISFLLGQQYQKQRTGVVANRSKRRTNDNRQKLYSCSYEHFPSQRHNASLPTRSLPSHAIPLLSAAWNSATSLTFGSSTATINPAIPRGHAAKLKGSQSVHFWGTPKIVTVGVHSIHFDETGLEHDAIVVLPSKDHLLIRLRSVTGPLKSILTVRCALGVVAWRRLMKLFPLTQYAVCLRPATMAPFMHISPGRQSRSNSLFTAFQIVLEGHPML